MTYPDVAGANFGTFAVLAALERRERTGEGMWLDLSHYEAGVATIPEGILEYTMNGRIPPRIGNRHPRRAPQGVYPCAGLDRWVAISVATDDQFARLATVLGRPGPITERRFATHDARLANHDALDEVIAKATAPWEAGQLERQLQAQGVEATTVQHARDILLDPQLKHRGYFQMVPPPTAAPEVGLRPHPRVGWKMSVSPALTRSPAPPFGQHTDEVLQEYLGMDSDEVAALETEGIIARQPRDGMVSRETVDLQDSLASGRFVEVDPDYRARLETFLGAQEAHEVHDR